MHLKAMICCLYNERNQRRKKIGERLETLNGKSLEESSLIGGFQLCRRNDDIRKKKNETDFNRGQVAHTFVSYKIQSNNRAI